MCSHFCWTSRKMEFLGHNIQQVQIQHHWDLPVFAVGLPIDVIPTSCICVPCSSSLPALGVGFCFPVFFHLNKSGVCGVYRTAILHFPQTFRYPFIKYLHWGWFFSFCHFSIGLSGDGTLLDKCISSTFLGPLFIPLMVSFDKQHSSF